MSNKDHVGAISDASIFRHILYHNEQSLLDLANTDPIQFKRTIRAMIQALPPEPELGLSEMKEGKAVYATITELPTSEVKPVTIENDPANGGRTLTLNFKDIDKEVYDSMYSYLKGGILYPESDRGTFLTSIDWSNLRISYEELSGGFTVCLLVYPLTPLPTTFLWRGVSRCSHHDKPIV